MRYFLKRAIVILILIGIVATALFYSGLGTTLHQYAERTIAWNAYSWRARLFLRKLAGDVTELSWDDLWRTTRQPGGFSLENIFVNGSSLEGALANPFTQAKDLAVGQRIFRENCAVCHGADAAGLHAPPLNRPGFKNGDSDLRIYRVLRDGVPNTGMAPTDLSFVERWQVIGYLRNLQLHFQ